MLLPAFFRSLPTAYPFRSSMHVIAISPVPAFRVPSIRRHPRLVTTSSPDLILRGLRNPVWHMGDAYHSAILRHQDRRVGDLSPMFGTGFDGVGVRVEA
jgi:hypothetical protein